MEDHCLRAMKIVHHHGNGRFDQLLSRYQSVNPSREVISVLWQILTFVHPVDDSYLFSEFNAFLWQAKKIQNDKDKVLD